MLQFGTVVGDNHCRTAAHSGYKIEFSGQSSAGERCIRDQSQTFAHEIVDDGENAEPAAVAELIT
jgi:hypothetical protein